ncbi:MAG: hypothetical protein WBG50_07430 [Desulfomonilaceae bacterium]
MATETKFRTYQTRIEGAQKVVQEEFANDVIKEFSPIVARFGFIKSGWNYDKDLDVVRVYFEDTQSHHAVQIDCDTQRDTFTPNYCRQDEEWEICTEGKPKSFIGLQKTIARWLQESCEECCIECPTREEIWEAEEYA